jgi:anti-anti-sigma factor
MLAVNIKKSEHGIVISCAGRIIAGTEIDTLRSVASAYRDQEEIVLDLANVSAIDGAGLGVLASLQSRARATGSRLVIQNPSSRVRQLLELTNLDSVIEISPSREFQHICDTIRQGCGEKLEYAAAH